MFPLTVWIAPPDKTIGDFCGAALCPRSWDQPVDAKAMNPESTHPVHQKFLLRFKGFIFGIGWYGYFMVGQVLIWG